MPYALLSCSFVTLLYCYCSLNEINGDGDGVRGNFTLHTTKLDRSTDKHSSFVETGQRIFAKV